MKRNYRRFSGYVRRLTKDIYAQPPDKGHVAWAINAAEWIATTIYVDKPPGQVHGKVLDVGCGQAFMCPIFEAMGMDWTGVAIGEDVTVAKKNLENWGKDPDKVMEADMTFLPFEARDFNLIFARHVLEHSPFPIITLMEWRRVVKSEGHLCIVAPAPHWWLYRGKNHYSIVPFPLLKWWANRAGWHEQHEFIFNNRHELFLKFLTPYQEVLPHVSKMKGVLDRYPEGPVEFRLICVAGEEIAT